MLKSVLYYLLFFTTAIRLIDLVYLLAATDSNLPGAVFFVASAMIVYGVVLLVKRFVSMVRLKQLMYFYLIQIIAVGFNLTYVALVLPVEVTLPEMLIIGTFLDILVSGVVVYLCVKQRRTRFITVGGF